jgi:hypothetical protein
MSQSGYERLVDANPNPLKTCFCGVLREDCPGGPGVLSPQEIEGPPGNYANFISLECIQRLATDTREQLHVSQDALETPEPVAAPVPGEPPRHENPVADSLEEAHRLLAEREAERVDDGPVI